MFDCNAFTVQPWQMPIWVMNFDTYRLLTSAFGEPAWNILLRKHPVLNVSCEDTCWELKIGRKRSRRGLTEVATNAKEKGNCFKDFRTNPGEARSTTHVTARTADVKRWLRPLFWRFDRLRSLFVYGYRPLGRTIRGLQVSMKGDMSGQWAGPLDLYGKEDAPAIHESPSYGWNSWCQHGITGRISS